MKKKVKKWIGKLNLKEGALRRALHIRIGEKIPLSLLKKKAKAKGKMGKRARLALLFRRFKKK